MGSAYGRAGFWPKILLQNNKNDATRTINNFIVFIFYATEFDLKIQLNT
jgi:hypothetical protein